MINNDPIFPWLDDLDFAFDAPAAPLLTGAALRLARKEHEVIELHEDDRRTYRHEDFLWDTSTDDYWCRPLKARRSAIGVDSMIPKELWRVPPKGPDAKKEPAPVPPSKDIRANESNQQVEGSTWMPGSDDIIRGIVAEQTGMMEMPGTRSFNLYRPAPPIDPSRAAGAQIWVDHVKRLFPEPVEHEYLIDYCAHMIQRPGQKCNAAIVLSGGQGVGKDALLKPVRQAVGTWNVNEIGPDALLEKYNPWVKSVMLVVNEVRAQNEDHRATAMYDVMKPYMAAPPDVLPMNDKFEKVHYVANVMRMFLTTNERLSLYIPPDDRRILVLHSPLQPKWHDAAGDPDYFLRLFAWVDERDGARDLAAFLAARDISHFNPHGNVPRSGAWGEVQQSWEAPDDEVTAALEALGHPEVLLGTELPEAIFDGQENLARAMRSKAFVYRMQKAGYKIVSRPAGVKDWRAKHGGHAVKSAQAWVREALGWSAEEAVGATLGRARERAEAGKPLIKTGDF